MIDDLMYLTCGSASALPDDVILSDQTDWF